ncbi:MFS transporter [Glutamicibacter halophytocola]|uniref:MFS transporter n=1 Tax=Glutamicibacter halophytocola TaxID=1933880 RepID=UPI0006D4A7CC|nr:MFS transporter [Glutamicibacter halophytocola]ALG30347.1 MFS transporter [Glutamicibacter halophytocola]
MTTSRPSAQGLPALDDSAPAPKPRSANLLAGTVGHFVEWYDWYIYGLLAAIFSGQIFPSESAFASLMSALLTYSLGFVVRPLSGIIISPFADRYGRRRILTIAISGMALGALIIGLTPSFDSIGYLAPILFVIARIMQGISSGTEMQSAIAFMVEHAPANRRALFGSFTNAASGFATLCATGAAAAVTAAFTPEDLAAYGWRIPFIIGGVFGVIGLVLRAKSDETPEFEANKNDSADSTTGKLKDLLRNHPKALIQTAALSAPAVAYYTWATFLPTFANLTSGRNLSETLAGSVIGLALLVIIVPFCGYLSDRIGRQKIFPIIGASGMIVLFYPMMLLLEKPGFWVYVLVSASGWVVLGIWQAIYPTIQAELFPASVRVSGIGFAHQIVIAIFGGTAPLIATAFVSAGHPMLVAVYMIVVVAICLGVYFTLPETGHRSERASVAVNSKEANDH